MTIQGLCVASWNRTLLSIGTGPEISRRYFELTFISTLLLCNLMHEQCTLFFFQLNYFVIFVLSIKKMVTRKIDSKYWVRTYLKKGRLVLDSIQSKHFSDAAVARFVREGCRIRAEASKSAGSFAR